MKRWLLLIALMLTAAVHGPACAADGPPRLALVINQVDYRTLTPLPDTDGEAKLIADALQKDGFDVTRIRDATLTGIGGTPSLDQGLKDFRRKLAASPGALGFIYYTGHGMADPTDEQGDNYLLAIDADVKVAADLPASGIKLGDLLTQMSRTEASAVIIVIDACRNTPSLGKAASKGLIAVNAQPNTLVAYSTDAGEIAGVGIYAPVLAKQLVKPGMSVGQMFEAVQIEVSQTTGRKQRPYSSSHIYDTLCLAGCQITVNNYAPALDLDWQKEQAVWSSSHDCGDFRAYLAQYPKGAFAAQAQMRLEGDTCAARPVQAVQAAPVTSLPASGPASNVDWVARCDMKAGSQFDSDRPSANAYAFEIELPDEALDACQKAHQVKPDDRHVAYDLGRAYLVNKDYDNARLWFQTSADAGNAAAMLGLGRLYSQGTGVPQDLDQMRAWYQKSADAGDPEAMTALGILYDSGWSVDEDKKLARKWYKAAAAAGDPGGKGLLDLMD